MKRPKTRNGVREVPIHPHLVPLLKRLVEGRSPSEPLVPLMSEWSENQRAVETRQHLRLAGVTRPRLTENTATTMHVGFRSWRDTGITWLALAGVDVARIQRRAGHDEISTTIGYVKAVEDITGGIGEPFPPLPEDLVGPPSVQLPPEGDRAKQRAKLPVKLQVTGIARQFSGEGGIRTLYPMALILWKFRQIMGLAEMGFRQPVRLSQVKRKPTTSLSRQLQRLNLRTLISSAA